MKAESHEQAVALTERANARLTGLYAEILPKWKTLAATLSASKHLLSTPIFINVQPEYYLSPNRLVFVGQETHGWDTDRTKSPELLTVSEITEFYRKWRPLLFNSYPSPYWQALRELCRQTSVSTPESALVFSNLFISDVDQGQGPKEALETLRDWKVLPQELEILQPTHVVFFCGPVYAWNLHCYFTSPLAGRLSTQTPVLAYKPADGNWSASITYHPNYLRRNRQRWTTALEQIAARISQTDGASGITA